MTATGFLEKSLPPGDRDDDAPELDLDAAAAPDPAPAPTLNDPVDGGRWARCLRHHHDAGHQLNEALLALSLGRYADARSALAKFDHHATSAATLSRLLADPPLMRARTKGE